jgi:hypothetical protein
MQALLVLGFAAAFGAFWLLGNRYKAGEGPFDQLPPAVPPKPAQTRVETVADGTRYRVFDWDPIAGRSFHVAEVKGKPAWISFWIEPTGQRTMHRSLATAGDLNDLRKDWVV